MPGSCLAKVWRASADVACREFGRAFLETLYKNLGLELPEDFNISIFASTQDESRRSSELLAVNYPPRSASTGADFATHLLLLWREFLASSLNESPGFVFQRDMAACIGNLCKPRGGSAGDLSDAAVHEAVSSRKDLQTPLLLHHLGEIPLILEAAKAMYLRARRGNELPPFQQPPRHPLRDSVGLFSNRPNAGPGQGGRQAPRLPAAGRGHRSQAGRPEAVGLDMELDDLVSEFHWGEAGLDTCPQPGSFPPASEDSEPAAPAQAVAAGEGTASTFAPTSSAGSFTRRDASEIHTETELADTVQYGLPGHAALVMSPDCPKEPEARNQPLTDIMREHDCPCVVRILSQGGDSGPDQASQPPRSGGTEPPESSVQSVRSGPTGSSEQAAPSVQTFW